MAQGGGSGELIVQTLPPTYAFTIDGKVTVRDLLTVPGKGPQVTGATGQVEVAPVGAAITADVILVNRSDGSTVATLGTLTIPAGSLEGSIVFGTPRFVPPTRALKVSVTQIGSPGTEGSDLVILVS
jgi:hypothetical protein